MLIPLGTRYITTLRKLPTQSPKSPAKTYTTIIIIYHLTKNVYGIVARQTDAAEQLKVIGYQRILFDFRLKIQKFDTAFAEKLFFGFFKNVFKPFGNIDENKLGFALRRYLFISLQQCQRPLYKYPEIFVDI